MNNVEKVINDFHAWLVNDQHQKHDKAESYRDALICAAAFYELKKYEDIFRLKSNSNDELNENFKNKEEQIYFSTDLYVLALEQLQKYLCETGISLHLHSTHLKIYKENGFFYISDTKRGFEKQRIRNFLAEKYGSKPPFDVPRTSKRNTRQCVKELVEHETNDFFDFNKS